MTNAARKLAGGIATQFDVEKVILFGSRARGTATSESDVDLLVVMRYRGRETDQAVRILTRVDPRFAVDLVVRTPADVARRYRQFDPLIREAIDNGVVLYAKRRAGMGVQGRRRLSLHNGCFARERALISTGHSSTPGSAWRS